MLLGFLTGGQLGDLKTTLKWAEEHGFDSISISTRPGSEFFEAREVLSNLSEYKKIIRDSKVIVSAIGFYGNPIHPDESVRKEHQEYFTKLIDIAYKLEIKVVTGWIGKIPGASVEENLSAYAKEWPKIVKHAEDVGVKIAIENCPGNIAYRPDIWRKMFELIPSTTLGLEFDPSHLICQMIDPIWAADEFGDRIHHTHCKDAQVLWDKVKKYGITATRWCPHRLPGFGDLNWAEFISILAKHRYDYALSIEHEDPYFDYKKGLLLARNFLRRFIVRV